MRANERTDKRPVLLSVFFAVLDHSARDDRDKVDVVEANECCRGGGLKADECRHGGRGVRRKG